MSKRDEEKPIELEQSLRGFLTRLRMVFAMFRKK